MSDYAKFKQTGLSRYITIGNAKLKPVEPVAPAVQPKLQKKTFRQGKHNLPSVSRPRPRLFFVGPS
jgi:hypothetical protein